jgi:tRNA/rRNA methyltransferase
VVATTGRLEGPPLPLLPPADALAWLLERSASPQADPVHQQAGAPGALVFGREDRGLANGELLQAGRLLQIGTGPSYPSLNLSHAVAVVLHELHTLRQGERALASSSSPGATGDGLAWADPCRRQDLEATLADAEALLLEVGFLLPHTSRARMAKLRALLQRAQVSEAEVALLRGMVCQLRWASRRRAG